MPESKPRLTELTKCVPVLFVVLVIVLLYCTYVFYHLAYMFQINQQNKDTAKLQRGVNQLILFCIFSTMLIICYVRSIFTSPGEIPDTPEWQYNEFSEEAGSSTVTVALHETKRTGERRHCKWCQKYKPDRCHHCRVCRTCILKMDHHCPWIYNCVGFMNHKFFFLLLFYTFLTTQLIVWTMSETVKRAIDEDDDFTTMFVLVFTETLCAFLAVLVTAFFLFHIWLCFRAMTTIEFCEKSMKKTGYSTSAYDRGILGNLQEVIGPCCLYWLVPILDPPGTGLSFVNEGTRLTVDLDVGRQIKKTVPRRSRAQDARPDDPDYLPAPSS